MPACVCMMSMVWLLFEEWTVALIQRIAVVHQSMQNAELHALL